MWSRSGMVSTSREHWSRSGLLQCVEMDRVLVADGDKGLKKPGFSVPALLAENSPEQHAPLSAGVAFGVLGAGQDGAFPRRRDGPVKHAFPRRHGFRVAGHYDCSGGDVSPESTASDSF